MVTRALCLAALSAAVACGSDDGGETMVASTGAGVGGGAGSPPTGEMSVAVTRYELTFDVDAASLGTRVLMDVAPPGGDCVSLASELAATDVQLGGAAALSSSVAGGTLHACGAPVSGPTTLDLSSRQTVPLQTFHGLDVGFSRKLDLAGANFSYLISWVGGCDHFGPCDDAPSTLAEFAFEVTHQPGTTVLCPGALTPGNTLTRCELTGTLAPTYSAFALMADTSWLKSDFVTAAGVNVVFYETPAGQIATALDPTRVGAFLDWITGLLGPFPYGSELRVAAGPTRWLGFEHPANIVLHEQLPQLNVSFTDPAMHVLMHEIVHQWAGDKVTLANTADFVWKEATAEYLAYVFEDMQGPASDADATRGYWEQSSLQATYHPRPNDEPTPAVQDFYGDVYGPGPMVLYLQLEDLIGRSALLAGIQSFLAEPGARSVDELRLALEAASSESLGIYFDAWVFGTGAPTWPTFAASTMQQTNQVTVTLTQAGATVFPCAVEVVVHGATLQASGMVSFGLAPASPMAQTTVTLAEPVVSVDVDPRRRVIDDAAGATVTRMPVWIF